MPPFAKEIFCPIFCKCAYARLRLTHSLRFAATFLVMLFGVAPHAVAQMRATVAPASLNHLVENAETIVHGHVLSVTLEPHPEFSNLQTVLVTLAVSDTLKGHSQSTLQFRQLNLGARDVSNTGYHKADELLLFLNPVSQYGLTSPVGLEQGHFRVLRDAKGNKVAVNGYNNVGLFSDLANQKRSTSSLSPRAQAALAKPSGAVSFDAFAEIVRSLAGGRP